MVGGCGALWAVWAVLGAGNVVDGIVGSSQRNTDPIAWRVQLGSGGRRGAKEGLILGKVVLVTGVARQLGGRFVRRIQRDPDVDRVIGVDAVPPEHHLGGAEFLKADIRHPAIARVLAETGVDTVVHMDINGTPLGSRGGRASVKETNVIGTMQLLGACQKAPNVRRLVIKSTTSVYGSAPRDPAVFTETTPPKSLPSGGFAKDAVEVEGYVRGFARRRPDVAVCVLRFANILGPSADSPLAEYFSLPVLPTVFGYDPRLQFLHEDDAIEVLRIAASEPRRGTLNSGTFNIAGDGRPAALADLTASRAAHAAAVPADGDVGRYGAALRRYHRLLPGTDPDADARQSRPDDADARDTGVPPAVHDGGDLRGIRPQPRTRAGAARVPRPHRRPARRRAARTRRPDPVRSSPTMADAKVIPFGEEPRARRKARRAVREGRKAGLVPVPEARSGPEGPVPPERPAVARTLDERIAGGLNFLRRRITGDYEVDDFGYDEELTDQVLMSVLRPLADKYFRVEVKGIENIPSEGGALVVANHSGTLPLDGLMLQVAVHDNHPARRHLRLLAADLVFVLPVINELARKAGHTLACAEDAQRLLERGEIVGVMPEGFKGIGKPFADRYKLQRFGRGGFVSTALTAGVPIVPCSIVGAEEIYPDDRQRQDPGAGARAAVLPDHADVPVAGPARGRAAADEVDDPVR